MIDLLGLSLVNDARSPCEKNHRKEENNEASDVGIEVDRNLCPCHMASQVQGCDCITQVLLKEAALYVCSFCLAKVSNRERKSIVLYAA